MRRQDQPPTSEQLQMVRWAASLGAVTAEALAQRNEITVASALGKLAAAQRRELLSRERPLVDCPALFTPTRAGLRACDARGLRVCKVKPANASHLIACATAAAALERCYPHHHVVGERELRRDEREHGRPLVSAKLGASQGAENHCPDLVLWPKASEGGLPIAIEVELTIKAPQRLTEICRGWARCREVAGVIYLAPVDVERALKRAIAEACASEQVIVVALSSLPD